VDAPAGERCGANGYVDMADLLAPVRDECQAGAWLRYVEETWCIYSVIENREKVLYRKVKEERRRVPA
jgi:hypothetical protein